MKKLLAAAIIASNLFLMPAVNAEVKTYEGVGEYLMSDFETPDTAKERAKQRAEQNACEKAGVFVESNTEVVNMMVTKDEIFTMTGGILKVVNVEYEREIVNNDSTLIRAKVMANIDSNDIDKWLNRDTAERSDAVEKNLELQRAIDEQNKQIAELKSKLAAAESKQEKNELSAQIIAEDKTFLSNQQMEEAMKFYYQGDFTGAAPFCTRAIELNPENAMAYSIRGVIFYWQKDYNSAISDFNRAIQLNSSDYKNFYNRGLAHVQLDNYSAASEDFSGAINLNPNDPDSWYNRAICKQRLGDYYGSQEDLNKARALGYNG